MCTYVHVFACVCTRVSVHACVCLHVDWPAATVPCCRMSAVLKRASFVLPGLGTVSPLFRPSSNHSGLLAVSPTTFSPTGFVLCVFICAWFQSVRLQLCTFFPVGLVCILGESLLFNSGGEETLGSFLLSFFLAGRKRLGTPADPSPFTMFIVSTWERVSQAIVGLLDSISACAVCLDLLLSPPQPSEDSSNSGGKGVRVFPGRANN